MVYPLPLHFFLPLVLFLFLTLSYRFVHPSLIMKSVVDKFMALPLKAVVGASNDWLKFGNKVLRCYQVHIDFHSKIMLIERQLTGILI